MLKSYSFLISSIHSSTRLHCIKPCSTGLRRFGIKCGNQSRLRFRFTAYSSFRFKSNSPFLSCQSLKKNEMLIKLYYSTKVENTGLSNRNSQLIKISKLIKPEAKSIAGEQDFYLNGTFCLHRNRCAFFVCPIGVSFFVITNF